MELMAFRHKTLILALAAALAFGFAGDAFARPGGGFSFGSRGARTFSMPPATSTAPQGAAPIGRSWSSASPAYSQGGFFSSSFGRGFFGGLMGAGLFGLLFGYGLFGGLGGGLSILGLLLQIALLYLLFKFVMGLLSGRPAFQGAGFGSRVGPGAGVNPRGAFAAFGGRVERGAKLELTPADFGMFEERLAAVQSAYGAEDLDRLHALATPEMVSYFREELAANARKGLINKLSDVKFLQGDLAEAWRESQGEYATVAMRFSLIDTMADRASGKIVSGDPAVPQDVTEAWTFTRRVGGAPGDWRLSAIQQAA
jgi:predicted lipid-binding transport protein (Tim44 family)